MVNISFTADALATNPAIVQGGPQFVLQLGPISGVLIPRDTGSPPNDPLRYGGAFQLQLRVNESISLEDTEFQVLVDNAKNGGDPSFLNRILVLVARDIIQVQQDDGSPLTKDQILAYTAP